MTRVALIHALAHSVAPINAALARDWPQCGRMNLLDDSLSADLAAGGGKLDAAMTARFIALADYAVGTGVDAILFELGEILGAAGRGPQSQFATQHPVDPEAGWPRRSLCHQRTRTVSCCSRAAGG